MRRVRRDADEEERAWWRKYEEDGHVVSREQLADPETNFMWLVKLLAKFFSQTLYPACTRLRENVEIIVAGVIASMVEGVKRLWEVARDWIGAQSVPNGL